MTEQRAIAEINQIYGMLSPEKQQALDVAIKALEQEPCDCISREKVINLLLQNYTTLNGLDVVMYSPLMNDIKYLPSVQPTILHGEWEEKECFDGDVYYDCSVCGNSWTTIDGTPMDNEMNFCPHCGADMRGNKE